MVGASRRRPPLGALLPGVVGAPASPPARAPQGSPAAAQPIACAYSARPGPASPRSRRTPPPPPLAHAQATPLVAGVGVAAAAFVGKQILQTYIKLRAAPPSFKAFYKGGFNPERSRREAALILGLRESAPEERS